MEKEKTSTIRETYEKFKAITVEVDEDGFSPPKGKKRICCQLKEKKVEDADYFLQARQDE